MIFNLRLGDSGHTELDVSNESQSMEAMVPLTPLHRNCSNHSSESQACIPSLFGLYGGGN